MKIAELFVALGFDIKGDKELVAVERNLAKAEGAAVMLLAGVASLNLAFYAMMHSATEAAVGLQKFVSNTGLSSEELQRWQLAAQKAGIQGEEMVKTITALQTAQKNVMLGQGDYSPFQFFGLSVSQDPFDQLKTLHEKFQTMDPAFARIMAARLGISENLFQWLRRDNLELDQFNQKLLLTNQQQKSLWNLNKAWQDIVYTLTALKNKFAESFAEPLTAALRILKQFLLMAADFIDWLNSTTVAANLTKTALLLFVAAMGAALVVLTPLVAALTALTVAAKLAALGLAPIIVAALPLIAVVGLMVAGIGFLILMLNDLWVAAAGGKSVFDWSASIWMINKLAEAIEHVLDDLERVEKYFNQNKGKSFFANLLLPGSSLFLPMMAGEKGSAGTTVHQENNTKIHVDGAGDPRAVAGAVHYQWEKTIDQAAGNLRLREY